MKTFLKLGLAGILLLAVQAFGQERQVVPASQAEVNAGQIHNKFVAPDTLAGMGVATNGHYGFVATGVQAGHDEYNVNSFSNEITYSPHIATDNINKVQLIYEAWNGEEVGAGGPVVYTASIEYPSNVLTQVTFNGFAKGTNQSPGTIWSDWITLPNMIPRGALFWVRTWESGYVTIHGSGAQVTCWNQFSSGSIADSTMSPGRNGLGLAPFWDGPAAIIGWTTRPTILFIGDSRTFGQNQHQDPMFNVGYCAWAGNYGNANCGVPSGTMGGFLGANTNRMNLLPYATLVVNGYGINDISSGQTVGSFMTNFALIGALVYPKPVMGVTIEPYTTSSDNWTTLSGQTPFAYDANRQIINNIYRSNSIPYLAGILDQAALTESSVNSGLWAVNGTSQWLTQEGIHANDIALTWVDRYQVSFQAGVANRTFLPSTGGTLNGNLTFMAGSTTLWNTNTQAPYAAQASILKMFFGGPGGTNMYVEGITPGGVLFTNKYSSSGQWP